MLLVISSLILSSCDLLQTGGGISYPPLISDFPATRTFNAQGYDGVEWYWYEVEADLMAEGTYCAVYVEWGGPEVTQEMAHEIAVEFDTKVYTKIRETFAVEEDVDQNEKVIILLLDIQDGYTGSGGYYAGYFDPTHMLYVEHSNQADMLFIDTDPGLDEPETLNITLAHEFQHLVNYSEKVIRQGNRYGQDTWINEGLSAGAEYVYLEAQNQWKINYYNNIPPSDPDYIREGQNFVGWGGTRAVTLANYSTVYLFFQWLRAHAFNGTGIYGDILANINVNYIAVEESALSRFTDYQGTEWKHLLRDWLIANWFDEPTGFYGYNDKLGTSLNARSLAPSGGTYPLYPGDGVYIGISSEYSGTPGVIDYAGLDKSTKDVYLVNPYEGNILVVFNSDGVYSKYESSVPAPVPASSISVSSVSGSTAVVKSKSLAPPRTRFPIGAVLGPDGMSENPEPRRRGR